MKAFDLFNFGNSEDTRQKDHSEELELKRLFPLPEDLEIAYQKMEFVEGYSPRDVSRLAMYGAPFWKYITTRRNRPKPLIPENLATELRSIAYRLGAYDPEIALVILYGSLDKGLWRSGSDVDLAVVATSQRYHLGSPELPRLRSTIHPVVEHPELYSIHVITASSIISTATRNEGRGNFLRAIVNGSPIYARPKVLI